MNPGCSSVPALSVPPGFDPSGKYVVIMDAYGNSRILASPNGKAILVFDGADVYFATGADDFPIYLPGITKSAGPLIGLIGKHQSGRMLNLVNETTEEQVLKSINGQVYFGPPGSGPGGSQLIPSEGSGVVIRQPGQEPSMFNTRGLIYVIDTTGAIGAVEYGANGQFLAMVNGLPKFLSLPSGNIASGSGVASLEGVSAGSTSAQAVNATVPSLKLSNGSADITVANVNVNFSFANPNGNGGLDVGAELGDKWYYLYVISDGVNVSCVASLSPIAPNLSSFGAYQYFGFVTVFRNDSTFTIVTYLQRGRTIWTAQVNMSNDVPINTAYELVPQTKQMSTIIPPIAKTAIGIVGGSTNAAKSCSIVMAANATGTGLFFVGSTDKTGGTAELFKQDAGMFQVPILDGNAPTLYWKANSTDNNRRISFTGYSI